MSKKNTTYEVGYKRPPVEHQFKLGECRNPRGRPRKAVRALTSRQMRKEVIKALDTKVRINTPDGVREVTTKEAALHSLIVKAIKDKHLPSIRYLLELEASAVSDHEKDFADYFSFMDLVERTELTKKVPPENQRHEHDFLNAMRQKTRKILE